MNDGAMNLWWLTITTAGPPSLAADAYLIVLSILNSSAYLDATPNSTTDIIIYIYIYVLYVYIIRPINIDRSVLQTWTAAIRALTSSLYYYYYICAGPLMLCGNFYGSLKASRVLRSSGAQ